MLNRFITLPLVTKRIILGVSIALLALGSGIAYAQLSGSKNNTPTASPTADTSADISSLVDNANTNSPSPKSSTSSKRTFSWGVAIRPELFPDAGDSKKFLPEQFKLMKELGATSVRVDYNTKDDDFNKQILSLAKANNIQVIFIIPFGPNDIFTDKNLEKNAYNYVKTAVGKYKGQVPIWQLGTEVASVALVDGSHHGVDGVDYPAAKYGPVSTWLKAATKAAKEADPNAKRLVNDQWIHVGFFDKFIKDGGDFDLIGWNWFSDMGTDMENPLINSQTGQRYKLMNKLKSYGKDIWITEVNRRNGSQDGNEKAQSDYIQTMANYAYNNQSIKGFIVFHLMGEQGYGIHHVNEVTKQLGTKKQAFGTYQSIIKTKK
jgi:hypothetical protein